MEFSDRIKNLTGLGGSELRRRHREFAKKFPCGSVSRFEFYEMAEQIIDSGDQAEVEAFVANVFNIFDSNDDGLLDFEEFLMATSAKGNGAAPEEKLEWLFDHVYDKDQSGRLNLSEVEGILSTLITMENVDVEECSQKELILDIFREMDSNGDGRINKKEFVETAMSSQLLLRILTSAADREQKSQRRSRRSSKRNSGMRRNRNRGKKSS